MEWEGRVVGVKREGAKEGKNEGDREGKDPTTRLRERGLRDK